MIARPAVPLARDYDVLIIGAGPAGSAAARLLALCGHRVILIDRPAGTRRPLAESIPPSARKTLSALGMLNDVEAAGFLPWRGNTVWWADATPRVESFPSGESGYQVERGRFDALLRDLSVRAGAQVLSGLVRDVTVPGLEVAGDPAASSPSSDAGVRATVEVDGHTTRVTASFLLDASGRAGVVARRGLRQIEPSHHTVALAGVWRANTPWPESEATHTLVASHADGWAWSVPTEPGLRYVTVMVDPERTSLTRGASAADVYRSELGKVRPFAPLIAEATLIDGPWGADASLYGARRYAGPGFMLVGDAASFIDPLSSFGVKKALVSGWLAGVAVNTALRTPAMQHEALALFDRHEREVYASFRKQAAGFATDAVAGTGHPFWRARAASPDALDPDVGADPAALARDPDVLAALEDLRRRPAIRLRPADRARVSARAAIRGREIVMEDHLVLPAWPKGVRYLRNVDLILLSSLAPAHRDVGDLYEAQFRAQPGISLPDFLGALSTLLALGGLEHCHE